MKISLVQYDPVWENKSLNQNKILTLLKQKPDVGNLLVFPEMTLTGFTMNAKSMSEKLEGESVNFFSNLAKEYHTNIFAGIIEKKRSKFFNALVHLDNKGKLAAVYRKIHPFSYSFEDKYYSSGKNLVIANVNRWRIGLTICYDLRFPELYRLYAKRGVDLLVDIANWPDTRIEHWRALLKARAIENQCYVAGVNRVGKDFKLNYNGCSAVFDPMGKEIINGKNSEIILTADIDKNYVKEVRRKLPFLNDMKLI